jgi:hypothetical protein
MPWWASDPAPGIGTWPPLISPTSAMVWWGARHGRVVTTAIPGAGGDAVDAGGLGDKHRRQGGDLGPTCGAERSSVTA